MQQSTKKLLASYLDSLCPILYINHSDFADVDAELTRIAERTLERDNFRAKVIIIASDVVIPHELENFITLMDVPLPDDEEIRDCIHDFAENIAVNIDEKEFEELLLKRFEEAKSFLSFKRKK